MNVEPGAEDEVTKKLKELNSVKEAHAVWGPFDIIAKVEAHNREDLGKYITSIRQLRSVRSTLTLLVTEQPTASQKRS